MSGLLGRLRPTATPGGEMAQEKIEKHGGGDSDDELEAVGPAGQERREKLDADVDGLLDEIDDVLEENAEDFVRAYVQKGGQ
jgi:ubiquitin-like protein Pup